ncbi:MAG: signal peptidase I [Burkholderiales bacterium 35-55-47]|jgi:signal peptidase I|uniref:signal peptidase I n=1 Tax=Limnohabitans sp. TaxID=1907725 RepID=UPI000BCD77E5|nr:signal peptidase I [Limnohabitans sp.]OYY20137.1 MAG: signal peptidase I [Burkholderiales bacterium 35-55-47]OYZ74252.1 MAG: signal peptidase I [Burkholderiales bacterium 24-55-52]OZB01857.1 MAG: signal peptidase I [Burkholderiales bacterium 39-55-53]HQR86375.1 signal peptidase I [Limnohabitans sp.]HQS25708.1 signal peptidase I [Limnohabitans sp.]
MATLTAFVLAAFVGYAGSWYLGMIEGNFALLMFMATVVTGIYWLAEQFYFLPQRKAAAEALQAQADKRTAELHAQGITQTDVNVTEAKERLYMQPWWLDWTAGLFPVIAVVFVLRSFLFEPFKIPSGSMIPTLHVGDLILVNKFHYGVRLPVLNTKITEGNAVQRGDVMVFRYPPKPSLDYIKRVIGVPGDEVAYLNKQLTINGQPVSKDVRTDFFEQDSMRYIAQFEEKLPLGTKASEMTGARTHNLLNDKDRPSFIPGVEDFAFKDNCHYTVEGVTCKVPAGHYFMMGDNRDNSLDSRYWGFVPEKNIVGKAFFVWMNFGSLSRIGAFQ